MIRPRLQAPHNNAARAGGLGSADEKDRNRRVGEADRSGELDWLVSVDSTIVRAHQHAAGGAPRRRR